MQNIRQTKIASINNVCKLFGGKKVLTEVNITFYQGEVLSILGPNGAGKTTLINLMLGRLSVTSGNITILGLKPGYIDLKRQCGAMLQVASLPDMSTVKEHIQLFQSYYANPMPYKQVIELAQLSELEREYSKNLSGGQKQRLLFALAICGNPKLLFLDEPSAGMDVTARKSMWQAIMALKENGTSIILTTHYLEEADRLSDRIIMLNRGKVIQTGTPNKIKSKINTKTIRFICDLDIEQLQRILPEFEILQVGKYIEIRSNDSVTTLQQLFKITTDISDLTITGAALEDAFIQLNDEDKQSASNNVLVH